nr:unnamed protein product [Callosobruchus chinensis]
MLKFRNIFQKRCSVVGMVHVEALPGTPLFSGSVEKSVSKACKETEVYLKHNVGAIMIENMHDVPYVQSKHLGPEITATMSRVCSEMRKIIPDSVPFGVQVLACGNREALAIAKACAMNFVRVEGFVFSHIADEGITNANAGEVLRYRKQIQADDILVFTDIKKKHSSHYITRDISLIETAKAAEYFLSDGLILTGSATGVPAEENDLQQLKGAISLPILVGSGVTYDNLEKYLSADALIVGSYFKEGGKWSNEIDENRVGKFMNKMKSF